MQRYGVGGGGGGRLAPRAPTSLKGHDIIDKISYQPNIKEVQGLFTDFEHLI